MDKVGEFAANPVNLDETAKTFHLPDWKAKDDKTRIDALRQVAMKAGRDPRIATLAVGVIREAGAQPRDYKGQATALLSWVQSQIYYINEPGERLQDPLYTLRVRYGDCDDMAMLLAAMYEACRLPWRFVLSGRDRKGKLLRWVEGTPKKRAVWSHIYVIVGWPPYTPKKWLYAEPTLKGVPLGWDVVGAGKGGRAALPELAGAETDRTPTDDRAPLAVRMKRQEKAEVPFTEHVKAQVKERLRPRNLIPVLVVGFVSAVVLNSVTTIVTKKKKK